MTFGRESEKFLSMKAWIYIYTIVFAAGMVTALADEAKTNTQTSDTIRTPNTNGVAVPLPMAATSAPAPAVVKEVRPPAAAPLMQTSAVPVQSIITAAPQTPTNAITTLPMTATSAPAPIVTDEAKPPAVAPLVETSAVPVQSNVNAEPLTPTNAAASTSESFGAGHTGVWAGGVVILVGVLAIFMWRRSHSASQGSLITSAMNENQKSHGDKNAPPPMA